MASARPADLNPFIIVSFSSHIWLQKSTSHWACNSLMSKSLADTLTFESSIWRASWADACFENQLSYLPEINVIVGLLTDISKGWYLFVRLGETMKTCRNFHCKAHLQCQYPDPWMYLLSPKNTVFLGSFFFFNVFQVRKHNIHEKPHRFWGNRPVIFRERYRKWFWEV